MSPPTSARGGCGLPVLAALAAFLVGLMIAALPVGLDGEQARLCRATLPAVEPEGRLTVTRVEADPLAPYGIRIVYTVRDGLRERGGLLRCAFAGGRFDRDRLTILGIETLAGELSEARLFMLDRFWLQDPDALRAGERRLDGLLGLAPIIPVDLPRQAGYAVQQIASGLPAGAYYALIASAFALVYGLTGRINLAFGQMAIVGSYVTAGMIASFGSGLAGGPGAGVATAVFLALLASVLHGGLIGALVGRHVLLPLAPASPRSFLIAGIGLALALLELVRLAAGSRDRWIQPILNDPVQLFGGPFPVTLTLMQIAEVAIAAAVLATILMSLRTTAYGRAWRAISDDPRMAGLLGIDSGRIQVATFALGSAAAGLAGGLVALHYGQASYGAGLMITLKALMAAVLGGIGSVGGAAAGGLLIGLAETAWAAYLPIEWRDGAVLAALVLLLIFKPSGLFGRARPAADSGDRRWLTDR